MSVQQPGAGPTIGDYVDLSVDIIDRLLGRDIRLFVIASKPMVELPATIPGRPRDTIPLSHGRFEDFLASFTWTELRCVPKPAEIKGIMRVLKGLAWEQQETELPLETARDHEPLLDAIILLMSSSRCPNPYENSAGQLKVKLDEIARREGLDTNHPGWPLNAVWLSRELTSPRLKPFLSEAGLTISRGQRTSQSRTIRIERNDGSDSNQPSPSPDCQASNPPSHGASGANDGNDSKHPVFDDIAIQETEDGGE